VNDSNPLPNQRHERFVLGLLEGKTDGQAYEDAGYKPHTSNPSRMSGNERIRARLAFLQSEAADSAGIDRAWVLRELQVVYLASMERNDRGVCANPAAANRALELLGKDIGMFKDAAPVNVNVNLPGDESAFSERLAARRKERANQKTQLH